MKTEIQTPQHELFNQKQFAAIRAKEYKSAMSRLERFAQQASPKETAYDGVMKHTYWFDEQGQLQAEKEPIDPKEKLKLDTALNTIRVYENEHLPYQEEIDRYYAEKAENGIELDTDDYDLER